MHTEVISDLGEMLSHDVDVICISGKVLKNQDGTIKMSRGPNSKQIIRNDSIEAIFSKTGPPLIAIQWHAEAFIDQSDPNPHKQLLKYALQSGAWNVTPIAPRSLGHDGEPSVKGDAKQSGSLDVDESLSGFDSLTLTETDGNKVSSGSNSVSNPRSNVTIQETTTKKSSVFMIKHENQCWLI